MNTHLSIFLGLAVAVSVASCQQDDRGNGLSTPKVSEQEPAGTTERPGETEAPSMRELDKGPAKHVSHRPNEIEWRDGPGSFEKGAQFAVLEGDPAASGVFTLQLKVPDQFVINPHWHPNVERVTVLKGTFHLGSGDQIDKQSAEALVAGSYTSMPPKMVHYAIAEGETIVQLTTVGPWEINYVKPEDDPRQRD